MAEEHGAQRADRAGAMIVGGVSWSRWTVALIGIVVAVFALQMRLIGTDGQAWRWAISSDGEGYHAYLLGGILHGNPARAPVSDVHFTPAGQGHVIQYYHGTALVQAPLFMVAHGYMCLTTHDIISGRELPYQLAAVATALACLVLGMVWVRRTLLRAGLSDPVVALTMIVVMLGSGLPYYTIMLPAMSHLPGFAAAAWALAEAQRLWLRPGLHPWRFVLAVALLVSIRPTHLLLIPAFSMVALDAPGRVRAWLHEQRVSKWCQAMLVAAPVVALQPLLWYVQAGVWWADPYAGEGFNWTEARPWSVLFGARKGFFFYWPLLLLALPGLWSMWRRSRTITALVLLSAAAVVYVTSAWWSWYYGHGYGMRPLLDTLPLFALPIAWGIGSASRSLRTVITVLVFIGSALQVFQTWQYHHGIIHPNNMDREKYAAIFLRHDDKWKGGIGWTRMVPPFAPHGMDTLHMSTESGVLLEPGAPPVVVADLLVPPDRAVYVELAFQRKADSAGMSGTCRFGYVWQGADGTVRLTDEFPLNDIAWLDDQAWRRWDHSFTVPPAQPGERLRVHLWQAGEGHVELRDIRTTVTVVRPPQ